MDSFAFEELQIASNSHDQSRVSQWRSQDLWFDRAWLEAGEAKNLLISIHEMRNFAVLSVHASMIVVLTVLLIFLDTLCIN